MTLDEILTWAPHISNTRRKISCSIGVLYKIRHFFPLNVLINIYNAIFFPHLSYYTLIWGDCAKTLLNQVYVLQKRAPCAITNSHPKTLSDPLLRKLNVRTIFQIHELQDGSFMYMLNNNMLPSISAHMFKMTKDVHPHYTRHGNYLYIPLLKYHTSRRSVMYSGVITWNTITTDIRMCPSLASFKRKLNKLSNEGILCLISLYLFVNLFNTDCFCSLYFV